MTAHILFVASDFLATCISMLVDQSVDSDYHNVNPADPLHVFGEVNLQFVSAAT